MRFNQRATLPTVERFSDVRALSHLKRKWAYVGKKRVSSANPNCQLQMEKRPPGMKPPSPWVSLCLCVRSFPSLCMSLFCPCLDCRSLLSLSLSFASFGLYSETNKREQARAGLDQQPQSTVDRPSKHKHDRTSIPSVGRLWLFRFALFCAFLLLWSSSIAKARIAGPANMYA